MSDEEQAPADEQSNEEVSQTEETQSENAEEIKIPAADMAADENEPEQHDAECVQVIELKRDPSNADDDISRFIPPEPEEEFDEEEPQMIHDEDFHASMDYLKKQLVKEEAKVVDMEQFKLNEKDSKDPSYTNLVLPYRVICRQRYRRAGAMQRAQFIKEIKQHELLQSKALDGVRIHREFCNAIISQPKAEEMIRLTDKQKQRLEWIMHNEIR